MTNIELKVVGAREDVKGLQRPHGDQVSPVVKCLV